MADTMRTTWRVAVIGSMLLLRLSTSGPAQAQTAPLERIGQLAGFPVIGATGREIRVLNWTPTGMIPMAALRLIETGDRIDAQLVIAWHRDVSPSVRTPQANFPCAPLSMCVEVHDSWPPPPRQEWATIFEQMLKLDSCETPGSVAIGFDSGDFVMRSFDGKNVRDYVCNAVSSRRGTTSGQLALQLFDYLQASMLTMLGR